MVSTGFAGDSTQTMSASAGGGPVWSYSTNRSPHSSSEPKSTDVPKYAPSASAIRLPGRANASTTAVSAAMPEANRSAWPLSRSPSRASASAPVGWAYRE